MGVLEYCNGSRVKMELYNRNFVKKHGIATHDLVIVSQQKTQMTPSTSESLI